MFLSLNEKTVIEWCIGLWKSSSLQRASDKHKNNLLHYLAMHGGTGVMAAYAIQAIGVDVNARNFMGHCPLALAVDWNNMEVVQVLLNSGANVHCKHYLYKEGPLHIAASRGLPEMVELLLKNGLNPDDPNNEFSPLICCMKRFAVTMEEFKEKHAIALKILKKFVQAGAKIDVRDHQGNTLLHLATIRGYHKVVALLLKLGLKVDVVDKKKRPPIHYAKFDCCDKVADLLIEAGADINSVDKYGKTVLHKTLEWRSPYMLNHLLMKGIKMDYKYLLYALKFWGMEKDRKLNHDVSFGNYDYDEDLELCPATRNLLELELDCIEILIIFKTDVNYINEDGQSALTILLEHVFHSKLLVHLMAYGLKIDFSHPAMINYLQTPNFGSGVPLLFVYFALMQREKIIGEFGVNFDVTRLDNSLKESYYKSANEIELMKNTFVHESITYFQLLANKKKHFLNDDVEAALKEQKDKIEDRFHNLGRMIEKQFSSAYDRYKKEKAAVIVLGQIFNRDVNAFHVIFDKIISYLLKKDLVNLTRVYK